MEFKTPKTPEELNAVFEEIHEQAHQQNSGGDGDWTWQTGKQMSDERTSVISAKTKIIEALNENRQEGNKALSFYGPWIACEDGSIDYGPNEFYYLSTGWHKDKWILPHVLRKPWRVGTAVDLLRAMRDAGKAIGVENLDVNLSKIQ